MKLKTIDDSALCDITFGSIDHCESATSANYQHFRHEFVDDLSTVLDTVLFDIEVSHVGGAVSDIVVMH
tara:strand:+ start:1326 stop:1532 length:207 start_codon:yes stop_codon:yes gene_type:complete